MKDDIKFQLQGLKELAAYVDKTTPNQYSDLELAAGIRECIEAIEAIIEDGYLSYDERA